MIKVYKLGEGPFNYDWNIRYIKVVGSDLFYSPSEDDRDMKEINIKGAAISGISNIKEKNLSICVTIPPPINKSIFLATDSIEECTKLRDRLLNASSNQDESENYHDDLEEHITNANLKNLKNTSQNILSVGLSKINKFNKFYSEKFFDKLDQIKNEILSINSKYKAKYIDNIKIYSPGVYEYKNTYKIVISKKL